MILVKPWFDVFIADLDPFCLCEEVAFHIVASEAG
jgi:hypothetical protein